MERIAKETFPKVIRVANPFHIQKLAFGVLQ